MQSQEVFCQVFVKINKMILKFMWKFRGPKLAYSLKRRGG